MIPGVISSPSVDLLWYRRQETTRPHGVPESLNPLTEEHKCLVKGCCTTLDEVLGSGSESSLV
jgi:hypothetical protein